MNGFLNDPCGWGREAVRTRLRYRIKQLQTLGFTWVIILIGLALAPVHDGAIGPCVCEPSPAVTTLLGSGLVFVVVGTLVWPLMYLRALRAIALKSGSSGPAD